MSPTVNRSDSDPVAFPAAGRSRDVSKCAFNDTTSGTVEPKSALVRLSLVQDSLINDGRGVVLPASSDAT